MLRRRMGLGRFRRDQEGYEELDDGHVESLPTRPPPTQNIDRPLADASAMYKAISETKKSENDALGVLREAQKDVHTQMQATQSQQAEMYKTLLQQQKEEMRRVREESRQAAENSSAPFKEMLQFMASSRGDSSSRENLEALRAAHDSSINSLSREHAAHLDDLRRNSESRQTQLMDELNRTRLEFSQQIERFRNEYLEKEKSAKDEAFRHYQTQLTLLQSQTSESRERHRDELANTVRDKNDQISQYRQDLQELRAALNSKDHEGRMALIERENTLRQESAERERVLSERIAWLENTKKQDLLEERQRLKEEFEDRYNAKYEAQVGTAELKIASAEKEAKLRVERAESEAKGLVAIAKKELTAQYESQISRLEAQIDSLKLEYTSREQLTLERSRLEQESAQKERENQRLILENTAQSREALAAQRQQLLESKLQALESELEDSRQALAAGVSSESADPFDQLERLNAIKERLKAHGFIDSADKDESIRAEPEEDKPKDFFGKVLHYGPQFLGPILQRVDAATAVAQQAVAQQQTQQEFQDQAQEALKSREQKSAQQRQLEYEQAAAADRENALRERRRMLLQRREERERLLREEVERQNVAQEMELARQQTHVPTEVVQGEVVPTELVQAEVIPTEAVQADPTVEIIPTSQEEFTLEESSMELSPEEQDAFKQLADYVQKSLSEKKTASAVVNELRMAKMMGMFSEASMNSVLGKDFEDLVNIMSTYHNLRTPKARTFIRNVVDGLKGK